MWTAARITVYVTAALLGLGKLLSILGYADFDSATGMLDLHSVPLYTLAAPVAAVIAPVLAAVMAAVQWKKK